MQFYDLLNIFELNGLPSEENPYLFNGDFVDRGSFSVEVILTLFAFKCMSPSGKFSLVMLSIYNSIIFSERVAMSFRFCSQKHLLMDSHFHVFFVSCHPLY